MKCRAYQLPTGGPDPPWMKLWHYGLAGGEVGMVMVRQSPRISWTRKAPSTLACAKGGDAWERAV